jgi:hypothetical protein
MRYQDCAHPAFAQLLDDAIVRDGLPDHEDLDEMIAAQEKFLDAVGFESGGIQSKLCAGL